MTRGAKPNIIAVPCGRLQTGTGPSWPNAACEAVNARLFACAPAPEHRQNGNLAGTCTPLASNAVAAIAGSAAKSP